MQSAMNAVAKFNPYGMYPQQAHTSQINHQVFIYGYLCLYECMYYYIYVFISCIVNVITYLFNIIVLMVTYTTQNFIKNLGQCCCLL